MKRRPKKRPSPGIPSSAFRHLELVLDLQCDAIAAEAKRLCEMIDSTPDALEIIRRDNRGIDPNYLSELERVGRGLIAPELFMRFGPGFDRLKQCPLKIQRRYAFEPIDLVVQLPGGGKQVREVQVGELNEEQARKVFDLDDGN